MNQLLHDLRSLNAYFTDMETVEGYVNLIEREQKIRSEIDDISIYNIMALQFRDGFINVKECWSMALSKHKRTSVKQTFS